YIANSAGSLMCGGNATRVMPGPIDVTRRTLRFARLRPRPVRWCPVSCVKSALTRMAIDWFSSSSQHDRATNPLGGSEDVRANPLMASLDGRGAFGSRQSVKFARWVSELSSAEGGRRFDRGAMEARQRRDGIRRPTTETAFGTDTKIVDGFSS